VAFYRNYVTNPVLKRSMYIVDKEAQNQLKQLSRKVL
jgi:hypothetical protein